MPRLSPRQWKWIQKRVPIACVDVVPLRAELNCSHQSLGLILRETPDEGPRWCLVGGRLDRNEPLAEAVARELRAALGDEIAFHVHAEIQPLFVAQYFTERRPYGGHDSRQHAVGMIFCVPITGTVKPRGEALDFSWFDVGSIPSPQKIGFNQAPIIQAVLERLHETDCRNLER